jgi:hypothetical protein
MFTAVSSNFEVESCRLDVESADALNFAEDVRFTASCIKDVSSALAYAKTAAAANVRMVRSVLGDERKCRG